MYFSITRNVNDSCKWFLQIRTCQSRQILAVQQQVFSLLLSPSTHSANATRMLLQLCNSTRCCTATPQRLAKRLPAVRVTACATLGRRAFLGSLAPCCCGCSACGHRSSWYDTYFAFNMAHGMEEYESAIAPVKQAMFKQLLTPLAAISSSQEVRILEVGLGTGPNLPYYLHNLAPSHAAAAAADSSSTLQQQPPWVITGMEPNSAMWQYAQASAEQAGLSQQRLQLVAGDAQQMPFDNDTFHAAVITLVICSLSDPRSALLEVLRVLKPGGNLLLIEHVIAPQLGWLQVQQRLFSPLQQLLADNCHLTRDTGALVQTSGFILQPLQLPENLDDGPELDATAAAVAADGDGSSRAELLHFEVKGMGLIAPHIAGILQKPPINQSNISQ